MFEIGLGGGLWATGKQQPFGTSTLPRFWPSSTTVSCSGSGADARRGSSSDAATAGNAEACDGDGCSLWCFEGDRETEADAVADADVEAEAEAGASAVVQLGCTSSSMIESSIRCVRSPAALGGLPFARCAPVGGELRPRKRRGRAQPLTLELDRTIPLIAPMRSSALPDTESPLPTTWSTALPGAAAAAAELWCFCETLPAAALGFRPSEPTWSEFEPVGWYS